MTGPLHDVDVAILAGGLGTRIRGVLGDTPKVLGPVAGRAFLDHLLDRLEGFGARRIILLLGHLADKVTAHLAAHPRPGLDIVTVVEPEPMGTGGAVRFAAAAYKAETLLLLNGDTFVDADLGQLVQTHRDAGCAVSLLSVTVPDAGRYGRLDLDPDNKVNQFLEKDPSFSGSAPINAGVYVFSSSALADVLETPGPSLERDYLEKLAPGSILALPSQGRFIDIGTPESYAMAAEVMTGKPEQGPNQGPAQGPAQGRPS